MVRVAGLKSPLPHKLLRSTVVRDGQASRATPCGGESWGELPKIEYAFLFRFCSASKQRSWDLPQQMADVAAMRFRSSQNGQ